MTVASDQIKAYYDTDAYVSRNPIIPVRARLLSEILRETRESHILDLGCGDGTLSRSLLRDGNRLTLVDFSRAMLDRARARFPRDAPVEFVEADMLNYHPLKPADVVVCIGVLAHVRSPEALIAHIAEIMRPNGLCVLEIIDCSAPMGWLLTQYGRWRHQEGWEKNRLSRAELVELATAHHLAELPTTLHRYGLLFPGPDGFPNGSFHELRKPRPADRTLRTLLPRYCSVFACFPTISFANPTQLYLRLPSQ